MDFKGQVAGAIGEAKGRGQPIDFIARCHRPGAEPPWMKRGSAPPNLGPLRGPSAQGEREKHTILPALLFLVSEVLMITKGRITDN